MSRGTLQIECYIYTSFHLINSYSVCPCEQTVVVMTQNSNLLYSSRTISAINVFEKVVD